MAEDKKNLSMQERLLLIQKLNSLPHTQFDELVFALAPPSGNIPSSSAAQGSRSIALLQWIESPLGPGLSDLEQVLANIAIAPQPEGLNGSSSQPQQIEEVLKGIIQALKENQAPKYDLRGAQFAGSFAETVQGDQLGGTINNYGANLDDITRLITALREQAQTLPAEHKDEALDVLDDLEADISKSEPDTNRIGRRLKRLVAIATAAGAIAGSAATFSGNLNQFTDNVVELTGRLGVPIEQVQPNQIPPASDP
ncbi:MAG: hypothetical protein F6K04_01305 [Leptolyngbya sp. SIO4C5]|nr:hypothetical protein [Leptolyngbya sp. SIO4C5]